MMRKIGILAVFLWMMLLISGCSSDVKGKAENWIGGNYYLTASSREQVPEDERLKFFVKQDADFKGYQVLIDKANGETEQFGAVWDEDRRTLKFAEGALTYSWFEYHVIGQFPVYYLVGFEAVAQVGDKMYKVRRPSYAYMSYLVFKAALGFKPPKTVDEP